MLGDILGDRKGGREGGNKEESGEEPKGRAGWGGVIITSDVGGYVSLTCTT